MNKRVVGIILAIILSVVGFLWFTKPAEDTTSTANASSHVLGSGTKNVSLIEYGDFQCPACGAYHPVVKAVVEKYKDQITFQFRNYPLESIHTNARAAARAAEAAHIQGKFWEMHDALYENQKSWETTTSPLDIFKSYAQQVGVSDLAKFETDYKSKAVNDIINADLKEGQKFSITGTPTFLLNGKVIENPRDQATFEKLLSDAIAKAK